MPSPATKRGSTDALRVHGTPEYPSEVNRTPLVPVCAQDFRDEKIIDVLIAEFRTIRAP